MFYHFMIREMVETRPRAFISHHAQGTGTTEIETTFVSSVVFSEPRFPGSPLTGERESRKGLSRATRLQAAETVQREERAARAARWRRVSVSGSEGMVLAGG